MTESKFRLGVDLASCGVAVSRGGFACQFHVAVSCPSLGLFLFGFGISNLMSYFFSIQSKNSGVFNFGGIFAGSSSSSSFFKSFF